ncbi:hypothetical protein B7755_012910 [Streptomyces sp. NBS 14/10]|uniref:hypothetical protein n=1 Tax=Streptomyces sp. NBS 14/10 TaxID=1945643 RepID=UPI0015C60E30|nr:hypothetical protein [Streptomyces sp. NBS 14/10]KAK1178967.1 hypothetical protein B7755_012910 [Streptomyces sp. NBS 14/10]
MSNAVWSFVHDDDRWIPRRTPEADANTVRAVETFVLPFGGRAWSVQDGLAEWRESSRAHGIGYSLSTAGAAVKKVSDDEVELLDLYGQFENVVIPAAEFEAMLEALAQAMIGRDPSSASP